MTNDLVFTTTFNGKLIAMNRSTGQIVWQQQLSAGTNAPVSIDGDTLVTVASFRERRGQKAEIIAYSLSAPSGSTGTQTSVRPDDDVQFDDDAAAGGSVPRRFRPRRG